MTQDQEDADRRRAQGDRRLLLFLTYRGPWERLGNWAFKVGADGARGRVRDGSLRGCFGSFCDRRDCAWREEHVRAGTVPAHRWKRP